MKDFLKKLIFRKKEELTKLQKRSDESEDLAEVRAIGQTMEALKREIEEAEEQLAALEDEGDDDGAGSNARGAVIPQGAQLRNEQVVGSFVQQRGSNPSDPRDTVEYRTAFMNFVCRGTPIPAEFRANETTTTGDVGAAIPTTYLNEIIQKLESYGNVYAQVRKLNIQGGVSIPISDLKPVANWIGEDTTSDDQELSAKKSITFSYYGIECKIAQSLLVNITTLKAFQDTFIPLATEAIVKGIEITIFNGNGEGKPLGVTKDTRVPETNIITLTEEEFNSWGGWHKKVKAKMKKAYRKGTFYMNQATFDGHIDGMEDKNGQPVGRITYGINGEEQYRFLGKSVETVDDECIVSYDDAKEGDVVAIFMNPKDYGVNSNMTLVVVKWTDHDSNKIKNKAIMIVDGKLIDANGVLIIKKGAAVVSV